MNDTSTPYSAYNARMLSSEAVAKTFVINDHYLKLLENAHSLLRGPRGTGKTTLLKMLTPSALKAWDDRDKRVPDRLSFLAIYIPGDIVWAQQLEELAPIPGIGDLVSKAAVTCNVLHSLIDAFKDIIDIYHPDKKTPPTIHKLCMGLMEVLELKDAFPTLGGIQRKVELRLRDILNIASRAEREGVNVSLPNYFYDDYFMQLKIACSVFEEHILNGTEGKWALCFDEMEIAPQWLKTDLCKKLRSTDQRFLFKFSVSPTYEIEANEMMNGSPSQGNDYTDIKLWYARQQHAKQFCKDMMQKFLHLKFKKDVEPEALFGCSPFDQYESYDPNDPTSEFWSLLSKQAKYDTSIKSLLDEKGINIDTTTILETEKKDQVLRKLKPVLLIRQACYNFKKNVGRSRKGMGLYFGADAISAISDGNPRWLIGLLNDLLLNAHAPTKISSERQEAILKSAGERFKALVNSLPLPTAKYLGKPIRLNDFMERVSSYFFNKMVKSAISLDPPNCFTVDLEELGIISLIERAVDIGALIIVKESLTSNTRRSIHGATLRLSFLLAPQFKLLLRASEPVSLSKCLVPQKKLNSEYNSDLFGNLPDENKKNN